MNFEDQVKSTFGTYSVISPDTFSVEDLPNLWCYEGSFKKSQTEGILYWQVGFNSKTEELITLHGYYLTSTGNYGKLQVDRLSVTENLSGRNIQEQGLLQAKSKYVDKRREGYATAKEYGKLTEILIPEAQLAKKYDLITGDPLKEVHFKRGITMQPKLDGIRARIFNINGIVIIYSRNNLEYSWLEFVRREATMMLSLLPQNVGLDCELYNPDLTFEELTSIIRTEKTMHPKNNLIKCYIFDIIMLNTCLDDRMKILRDAYLKIKESYVFTHLFVLLQEEVHFRFMIKTIHDKYVTAGYEGAIIRKLCAGTTTAKEKKESYYLPGRNNNLLKVKIFIDEEGTVIGAKEGEGRETGLVIWIIRDDNGKIFDCRPRGSFETRRYHYEHYKDYIGKRYTYRYFEKTEYDIPRFPVGIGFRDYE